MLHEFLQENQYAILKMTEKKSLELAGIRPSSDLLKQGLPVFYQQLMKVLILEKKSERSSGQDKKKMAEEASAKTKLSILILKWD